jgi:hypothetical protein
MNNVLNNLRNSLPWSPVSLGYDNNRDYVGAERYWRPDYIQRSATSLQAAKVCLPAKPGK